jgi:PAS domain S-box/diguanylate cyclase (GGDEF) domain
MEYIYIEDLPFGYALHKAILSGKDPVDFQYIRVNKTFESITGIPREHLIGKYITEVFPSLLSEKGNAYMKHFQEVLQRGGSSEFELYMRDLDKYYKIRFDLLPDTTYVSYVFDITTEVKRRELFKTVFLSMNDGVIAVRPDFTVFLLNKSSETMIGAEWKIAEGMPLSQVLFLYKMDGTAVQLQDSITDTTIFDPRTLKHYQALNQKSGKRTPVELSVVPIFHHNISFGYLIHLRDISEQIYNEEKISYITYHDSLTGLYNRTFFNENTAEFEKEEYLPLTLLMGDVNGLKLTNDAFGHLNGDELLKAAAKAIESACRESDRTVRWGGDEFIVVLPRTDEKKAEQICKRIREHAKTQKIDFLNLSISLGYATRHTTKESLNQILKSAEDMMYDVKLLESKSTKSKTLDLITRTLYERNKAEVVHSEKVGELCGHLGKAMGLDESTVTELIALGKVHDIGKIGVNQNILSKPSKLNDEEWTEVKKHPEIGYHILVSSNELAKIAGFVLAHHERYDGTGYPKGLKGNEIPLQSRILAVADAYHAMISDRPYQPAMPSEDALKELLKNAGSQFDPDIVAVLIEKVLTR